MAKHRQLHISRARPSMKAPIHTTILRALYALNIRSNGDGSSCFLSYVRSLRGNELYHSAIIWIMYSYYTSIFNYNTRMLCKPSLHLSFLKIYFPLPCYQLIEDRNKAILHIFIIVRPNKEAEHKSLILLTREKVIYHYR